MKQSEIATASSSTVSGPAVLLGQVVSPDADVSLPADIRGPSAELWDRHKPTIINMYGTMKLKDIRERMATEHGFHATYVMSNAFASSS